MTLLDEIFNNRPRQLIIRKSHYDSYTKTAQEVSDGNIIHAKLPLSITKICNFLKNYLTSPLCMFTSIQKN